MLNVYFAVSTALLFVFYVLVWFLFYFLLTYSHPCNWYCMMIYNYHMAWLEDLIYLCYLAQNCLLFFLVACSQLHVISLSGLKKKCSVVRWTVDLLWILTLLFSRPFKLHVCSNHPKSNPHSNVGIRVVVLAQLIVWSFNMSILNQDLKPVWDFWIWRLTKILHILHLYLTILNGTWYLMG